MPQGTDSSEFPPDRGVLWQAWDMAHFPELNVRGAVATAPLVAGEPLVSVPLSAGLTLDASTPCPFPDTFAARAAWDEVAHILKRPLYSGFI
jgi:hypothetical protein